MKDRKWIGPFIGGIVVGAVLIGVIGWLAMPGMMLVTHESRFDTVDETCRQLQTAIEANGWQSPAIRDMNEAMAKQGVRMDAPVRIVELCNATYASQVLETNPEVSTLMPCAWGVYEGEDGKVHVSGMNMALMGRMFGGNIAKVMGGSVAEDEQSILGAVVRH